MFTSEIGLAQSKVVSILITGNTLEALKNIIIVAKENGDFNSLNDALTPINETPAQRKVAQTMLDKKYASQRWT